MLPSMPPSPDCMASSTLRPASFTAAVIMSCSISTSPDCTTSGSIFTPSTCFWPFMRTLTLPPPAEASTTVSDIFCWSSRCMSCAFDIISCNCFGFTLLLLLMIDDGANLGTELLYESLYQRIVRRSAPCSRPSRRTWLTSRLRHRSSAHDLHLHRPPRQLGDGSICL